MEEITGTLALEREILDDARKKAARILAGADTEVARIRGDAAKRIADVLLVLEKTAGNTVTRHRDETLARLPLDKLRFKTGHADRLMREALQKWLDSLQESRIESYVSKRIAAAAGYFSHGEIEIRYRGITETCALRLANRLLAASAHPTTPGESAIVCEDPSLASRGIMVSGVDAELEASLELASRAILRQKRGDMIRVLAPELVEA